MELKKLQKKVDKQFFSTIFIPKRQNFYFFIGTHPHLYDGIDIDGLTINMINTYFYEYELNPLHFEQRFTTILQKEIARYNNIKNIELSKQILEIFTNKSNKTIITDAIRDARKMQASQGVSKESSTGESTSQSDSNSKGADKELPMQANGDDFDSIIDWSDGASNINENTTNNNTKSNTTASATINKEDEAKLAELEKKLDNGIETYKAIEGQAVVLINNITKYLYQPKAIDYLIEKLKIAFCQIY